MNENIGRLAQEVQTFTQDDTGKTIHRFFEDNIYAEGIVILDKNTPVGLIMRNDFYQTMGKQYGYSLYMNRPIKLIMKRDILVVAESIEVADVSIMAMNREQESLYDFVIVTEEDKYIGTVSIKFFLIELSKKREKEIELLKQQQEILQRSNELEKLHRIEMEEKNTELNAKNSSIRNLLDNAGQGFLSFNKDMIISQDYSLECTKIFRAEIGGVNFISLLGRFVQEDKLSTIESVFNSIFSNESRSKNKVYLSLLPKELKIKEKTIRFEYKTIDENQDLKIMLVLTDITDKKAMEMRMEEERNNLKLIVKVISNKNDLLATMEDFEFFFEKQGYDIVHSGRNKKEVIFEIFRIIHTFKGDFGHLGMYNTGSNLHVLENTIAKMSEEIENLSANDLQRFIRDVDYNSIMDKDLYIISDVLGEDYLKAKENIQVSLEKIDELEAKIKNMFEEQQAKELVYMIEQLKYSNIKEILFAYNDSVKNIAQRFEKEIADIAITGEDIYIDKNKYSKTFKSFVHIFRNSVDHGIEPPESRLIKGKPEYGTISCNLQTYKDSFKISIRDDGNGIHPEVIIKKAIEKGILKPDKADITYERAVDLLFVDEFSTKEAVSALSGRGVGLPAVKAEVTNLGGNIYINSEPDKYTEFIITLPLL